MAGVEQRAGHHRPRHRPARRRGAGNQVVHVDGDAERGQPGRHLARATRAVLPRARQEGRESRRVRIDEVGQHVHVAAPVDGGDLDAGQKRHAARRRGGGRRRDTGQRVVIGHAERADARRVRAFHQRVRRQRAVRGGRVRVQVDHGPGRTTAGGTGRARRIRAGGVRHWRAASAWRAVPARSRVAGRAARGTRASAARGARAPPRRTRERSACLPSLRTARRSA